MLLSGCFLDRTGLGVDGRSPTLDAATPPDAARGDASRSDASIDAGPTDAGGLDAAGDDAAAPCTTADEGCEGDVALVCSADGLVRTSCPDESAFCDGGVCTPWVCDPGTASCSADGADALSCVARGTGYTTAETCVRGCASGACRDATPCAVSVDHVMSVGDGSHTVDLCGQVDDQTPDWSVMGDDCGPTGRPGEDVLVRLEIPVGGRFRLELRDDDSEHRVDPILYLRGGCNDRMSQIVCDDYGGMSLSSSLDRDLPAGDVFVVLDSLNYTDRGGE